MTADRWTAGFLPKMPLRRFSKFLGEKLRALCERGIMPNQLAKFIEMLGTGDGVSDAAARILRQYKLANAGGSRIPSGMAAISAPHLPTEHSSKRTMNAKGASQASGKKR